MQSVEPESSTPKRVLLCMAVSDDAEELASILRELGAVACEIAQDTETALRRSLALHPELVLIDTKAATAHESLPLAAALRATTQAPFVYLAAADSVPPRELVELCASCLEKPVTPARVRRCLLGLTSYGEAERALRDRARTFQDELLASMAHELRAPVQGVSGFAQYLLEGKAGPLTDAQQTCLRQIELGAGHVLQVIQDTLELTDRAADTLHVRSEVVDTERALREVLQVLQAFAIRRRIAVQVSVDDRLGHVVCDATKLKQVLYNLLSNALKYTPIGGRVDIALLRLDADSFCVQLSDSGPGLTRSLLSHINSAGSEARAAPGRGLELTRRIVAALGGTLRAHDRSPSGAVLRVELPLAPRALDPYARS